MSVVSNTANMEPVRFWNEIAVPRFQRFRHILIHGLGAHGTVALARHSPKPGERVLDIGCGWGDSSIEMARSVGADGAVLGVDCCQAFIDDGQAEARRAGLDNLRFVVADAQALSLEPVYDVCFSRFGTMFFTNPVHAMRHLRGALRPGGRLLMVVWRRLAENDWVAIPKKIVEHYLPPPPIDGRSCGPGPFSMADPDTVRDILTASGFSDIQFEQVDLPMLVGEDVERAIAFQLQLGPAGEIVREAGVLGEQRRGEIECELRSLLAVYKTDRGVVMPSSSWTVLARAG